MFTLKKTKTDKFEVKEKAFVQMFTVHFIMRCLMGVSSIKQITYSETTVSDFTVAALVSKAVGILKNEMVYLTLQ